MASFGDANKQLVVLKKVAPENLQTLAFEAQLLFLNKDYKAARDKALLLLKFVPDTSQVLLLAGAIEFNLNSFIQAEAYLSKALGTAPESVSVRRWLALTHLYAGQPAKALKALEPILGKFESNDDLLLLAGEIFLQNGDIGKAEEMLAKATRLNPDDLKSRTALAIVRLNSNQSQNGFQELQAIAARDTSATADMALVASYLGRKEFDNALKVIDALEKKRPNNPLVFDLRGRVQMQKKDIAAARASFEHALRIRPGYFAAAAQLAEIDASESDLDSAAKRFESIIKIEPKVKVQP